MITVSDTLKKLASEKKQMYETGSFKVIPKCISCDRPLTLVEREKGNRCSACVGLLRK